MKTLFAAACATAVLASAPAFAQAPGGLYGTIGYTQISDSNEGDFDGNTATTESFDVDLGAITARLGTRLGPNFGLEAEGSFGLTEDEQSIQVPGARVDFTAKLRFEAAAFGVAYLPLAPNADLFARVGVGYAAADVEARIANVPGASFGSDDGDNFWGYGAGGQYFFDAVNGVRADYTRWEFEDEGANTYSIAYVRKF